MDAAQYCLKYSQNRDLHKYFRGSSAAYIPKTVVDEEHSEDALVQSEVEEHVLSRASSAMSSRKLEWDSGADIGYKSCQKLHKSSSLPILAKLTKKAPPRPKKVVLVPYNLDESDQTEASLDDKVTTESPSVVKAMESLSFVKKKIGLPDAESTPKDVKNDEIDEVKTPVSSSKLVGEFTKKRDINLHVTKPVTVDCLHAVPSTSKDLVNTSTQTNKKTKLNQEIVFCEHSTEKSSSDALASNCDSFEYIKTYKKTDILIETNSLEKDHSLRRSQREYDLTNMPSSDSSNLASKKQESSTSSELFCPKKPSSEDKVPPSSLQSNRPWYPARLEPSKSEESSSNSTYQNWREDKTLSERLFEEHKGDGDYLIEFAQKERKQQLHWINNEIMHLWKLKNMLEKKDASSEIDSIPTKDKDHKKKTTIYTIQNRNETNKERKFVIENELPVPKNTASNKRIFQVAGKKYSVEQLANDKSIGDNVLNKIEVANDTLTTKLNICTLCQKCNKSPCACTICKDYKNIACYMNYYQHPKTCQCCLRPCSRCRRTLCVCNTRCLCCQKIHCLCPRQVEVVYTEEEQRRLDDLERQRQQVLQDIHIPEATRQDKESLKLDKKKDEERATTSRCCCKEKYKKCNCAENEKEEARSQAQSAAVDVLESASKESLDRSLNGQQSRNNNVPSRNTVESESSSVSIDINQSDSSDSLVKCACCKKLNVLGNMSLLVSEHRYILCNMCLDKNPGITTVCYDADEHICTCYTELNTANISRLRRDQQNTRSTESKKDNFKQASRPPSRRQNHSEPYKFKSQKDTQTSMSPRSNNSNRKKDYVDKATSVKSGRSQVRDCSTSPMVQVQSQSSTSSKELQSQSSSSSNHQKASSKSPVKTSSKDTSLDASVQNLQSSQTEEYDSCACNSSLKKNPCCSYCMCRLLKTVRTKSSIAYNLRVEDASPNYKRRNNTKKLEKKKSLEEIRIRVPCPYGRNKLKKNNTYLPTCKKKTPEPSTKQKNHENSAGQTIYNQLNNDKKNNQNDVAIKSKHTSLQEYLKENRPDFVKKAEQRRQVLQSAKEQRLEKDVDQLKLEFFQKNLHKKDLKDCNKLFSAKEMKEINRKNYVKCSEVQEKIKEKREEKLKEANKLIVNLFTKKLQCSVLTGKRNFPIDANVISLSCTTSGKT